MVKNFEDTFSHFDAIRACDALADGRTNRIGVAYMCYSTYAVTHNKTDVSIDRHLIHASIKLNCFTVCKGKRFISRLKRTHSLAISALMQLFRC